VLAGPESGGIFEGRIRWVCKSCESCDAVARAAYAREQHSHLDQSERARGGSSMAERVPGGEGIVIREVDRGIERLKRRSAWIVSCGDAEAGWMEGARSGTNRWADRRHREKNEKEVGSRGSARGSYRRRKRRVACARALPEGAGAKPGGEGRGTDIIK
jgi:hypothetical protein